MTHTKMYRLLMSLVVIFAGGCLFASSRVASKRITQGPEKSLDIKRYHNEPLELVDLKVSEQSVKGNIQVKHRVNGEWLDNVEFQDKDEWFRRVKVRLRNISDKPVVNIVAYLYFRPPSLQPLYRVDLSPSRHLGTESLKPDEEIELTVTDQSWNQTAKILQQFGVDANSTTVFLSIDFV